MFQGLTKCAKNAGWGWGGLWDLVGVGTKSTEHPVYTQLLAKTVAGKGGTWRSGVVANRLNIILSVTWLLCVELHVQLPLQAPRP